MRELSNIDQGSSNNKIINALNLKLYAMATYCIPRLRVHLASGTEKKEAPLSKTEKEFQTVLSKVSNATILGECINIAIAKGTKTHLRKIISELKDQLRDAPHVLANVIGEEGIGLLKKL